MNDTNGIKQLLFATLIILSVAGCSSSGKHAPLLDVDITPKVGKYDGKAIQADRRLVLTTHKKEAKIPSICAEPFPEGEALLETLHKFNSTTRGQTIGTEDLFKFGVDIPFSTHPAVKFYRDGVFALCQAAMNDWINTLPTHTVSTEYKDTLASFVGTPSILGNRELSSENIETILETASAMFQYSGIVSEFERQLNELRGAVVDIFEAEAKKAKAEADRMKYQLEIVREANKKDSK